MSRGIGEAANHMFWDQFTALFRERYISHAHVNRMREEFLSLQKGDEITVMAFVQQFRELSYYVPDLVRTTGKDLSVHQGSWWYLCNQDDSGALSVISSGDDFCSVY